MRGLTRTLLLAFAVLYAISPIDFMPGNPIDDIIFLLLGYAGQSRLARD